MIQAVLLGNADTKRTEYFRKAAQQVKLSFFFADWNDFEVWKAQLLDGQKRLVKIDPPLWKSCSLEELDSLVCDYIRKLDELSEIAAGGTLHFLNHPQAIKDLLNKRDCKRKLEEAGLAVTKMLAYSTDFSSGDAPATQLVEMMRRTGMSQVFIKPVNGSGAAGISAFRIQPKTGRMALYTCAAQHPAHGLINTKRLRCFREQKEVFALLNRILNLDCIVERWYAKAQYGEYTYDLRAVVQDGSVEFLLGRLSKGPITNLHLNNHPLEASELEIPEAVLKETACLCEKAMGCFSGLRYAGIDLLLEKNSLHPKIIEMNAQGDLIYQDIFHHNRIYRREAEMMRAWSVWNSK